MEKEPAKNLQGEGVFMYLPLSALSSNQPDWIKPYNPITISISVLHTCWLTHKFRFLLLSTFDTEALNVHHMTKILYTSDK